MGLDMENTQNNNEHDQTSAEEIIQLSAAEYKKLVDEAAK